jgi:Bacterial Ig-like domain (group 3)
VASGDYAQTTTCASSLAIGASCTINVTFTPTVSGARSGAVTITSNASGSPNIVSLSGSASVVYGATVTFGGLVVNQTQQALAGALVTLTMSGITHSATTDAFGHFSIAFDKTGLPSTLAYLVSKAGYAPLASGLDLLNGSSLYVGTLVMEPLTPSLVVLDLAPGLHHVGDDYFTGIANSAFQMNTEGLYYDRAFTLTMDQVVATGGSITLFVKGAQCNNPFSINGQVLTYLNGSPSDGTFGTKLISIPMSRLVLGQNTLTIASTNTGCNSYDDFEFTNVILRLSGMALSLKSTTLLSASPAGPVVLGQVTTLTAQVNGSSGTPTGNIIFRDGGTPLSTAPLNESGGATYATNFDARLHNLTASYSGDAVYQPSEGSLGYLVTSAVATAIGIRTNPNPSQPGQKVAITTNVVPAANAGTISGTVDVSGDGQNCRITLPDASCSLTFASKGPKNITASYSGNTFYKASTAAITHFVGQRSSLLPILMLLLD